jgi:hypothetical protein
MGITPAPAPTRSQIPFNNYAVVPTGYAVCSPSAGVNGPALNIGAKASGNVSDITNGGAFSPGMHFFGIYTQFLLAYTLLGVETVTATVTMTFDDGTTASLTDSRTSGGTSTLATQAKTVQLAKSGHNVTNVSVVAQSTIPASTALVAVNPFIAMQTW